MKKFYYLLAGITMVLVTIIACEQASIEVDELQAIQEIEMSAKGPKADKVKVDICHWDAENEMYVSISIAPEAKEKHFANHMTDYGTHVEKDKYTFSPEGKYYFYNHNGTNLKGLHFMDITTWNGSKFTGSGENLNNFVSGYYGRKSLVEATIVDSETMRFEGTFSYLNYKGSWDFNGYIDECGGITLDYTTGDFYGPVPMPIDPEDDGWLNEPIPVN